MEVKVGTKALVVVRRASMANVDFILVVFSPN